MPITSGEILNNRYRIVKLLGQGGFGAVYRAWDVNLSGPCALKENFDVSSAAQTQFLREASMLFNLRHPNLPRVFDSFTIQGQGQYLVMDYIEGQDLAQMIDSSDAPLAEAQVLDWIGQVCDALEYMHSQTPPVIHRDLKPANIRITSKGQAIVVDFGIAKIYDPKLKTTMGARAVTPGYSPPEQYGMGITDPQSDIYALGATMYKLLTRIDPPASVDIVAGNVAPPAPVIELNPDVSPEVSVAIATAMQLNRSSRYKTVREFRNALFGRGPSATGERPADTSEQLREAVQAQKPGVASSPVSAPVSAQVSAQISPFVPPVQAQQQIQPPKAKVRKPAVLWLGISGFFAVIVLAALAFVLFSREGGTQATPTALGQIVVAPTTTIALSPTDTPPPPTNTLSPTQIPTQEPTPTVTPSRPPDQFTDEKGAVMLLVPSGEFQMGVSADTAVEQCKKLCVTCDCGRSAFVNAEPVHQVYLDDFFLDRTEVTNAQYAACVQSGECTPPAESTSATRSSYYGDPDFDNYPVIHVDWNQAEAFCRWRGGDLPTEAQWEKAARGEDGHLYPWGDTFDGTKANFCDANCTYKWALKDWNDGYADTAPVGSYLAGASPYGMLDMAGNVWEWVKDWYQETFYTSTPLDNPIGPDSGTTRSLRGGSWSDIGSTLRPTMRYGYDPAGQGTFFGFRCSRAP
jgi:eukaryotic-like serine/threonine-protein kinase